MSDAILDLFGAGTGVGETVAEDYSDVTPAAQDTLIYLIAPELTKENHSASPRPECVAWQERSDFLYDFYYRIWVFPRRRVVRNPRLDTDIPFAIWNAFPYPNTLVTIVGVDDTGLVLDVAEASPFRAIEYRTVNLQINSLAPREIDASYSFNFTDGLGLFNFIAELVSIFSLPPNVPVRETVEWLTNVMESNDGTEQRIALRAAPRITLAMHLVATSKEEVVGQFDRQMLSLFGETLVPYFQYGTKLTQDHISGDSTIYFNAAKTDIRDGEYALIKTRDGDEELVKVVTVGALSTTIDPPLSADASRGSLIFPVLQSIVKGDHSMDRYAVDAVSESNIVAISTQHRTTFARPGSDTEFPDLDGFLILDKRPMANANPSDTFQTGTKSIDYLTGFVEQRSDWPHTQLAGGRQYLIKRTQDPAQLDFWRDFLTAIKGRQVPFLTPTYREDLYVAVAPLEASGFLTLSGPRYADSYSLFDSHKHLRLWTSEGPHDITVTTAERDGDTNSLINFTPALPVGVGWTDIRFVSFLLKVRLGDDSIELEHGASDTTLSLSLRSVDE